MVAQILAIKAEVLNHLRCTVRSGLQQLNDAVAYLLGPNEVSHSNTSASQTICDQ